MAVTNPCIWIKTRDGSPTLWSDEISEPFRSTKGAFTESWAAFVRPALTYCQNHHLESVTVGEFGLGPGTNWVLWSVAAMLKGVSFDYHVVERSPEFFDQGVVKWRELSHEIFNFVIESLVRDFGSTPQKFGDFESGVAKKLCQGTLSPPKIYSDLDEALNSMPPARADVWFHDPFGYAVNPEAYSLEVLTKCYQLWSPQIAGFSYAANRNFREAVEALNPSIEFNRVDTGLGSLKRQRSEFYGRP